MLVGRRQQQEAGVGLEIERFIDIDRGRPGRGRGGVCLRHVDQHRRAPPRFEAHRRHAREPGDLVAPGAGGIDHDGGRQRAGRGVDEPATLVEPQAPDGMIEAHLGAVGARLTQETLVQRIDLDVGRTGVDNGAPEVAGQEHWEALPGLAAGEFERRGGNVGAGAERGQRRRLIGACEVERVARHDERHFREPRGRIEKERPAGPRERADDCVAIKRGIKRGGAAGGVHAGMLLGLEHGNPAVAREGRGDRRACHASADDDEVEFVQGAHFHTVLHCCFGKFIRIV